MNDDLIDDTGFELGQPTHVEMLQHYNSLLEAELNTTRLCLRKAHSDIAGLIVMYRDSTRELAALKIEHSQLLDRLNACIQDETKSPAPTLTYAYGDYSKQHTKR